jgi:hypothetical protein
MSVPALLCAPGLRPALGSTGEWLMAQASTLQEVPPAPSTGTAPPSAAPTGPSPPAGTAPAPAPSDPPANPPDPSEAEPAPPADGEADDGDMPENDELSLGEIPIIETVELTPDLAKRALDSYLAAREKYANTDLELYENLQDFVDQTEEGKSFEADIKAAGFANVTDWNLAITTLGLVYGSLVDDQSQELELQIKEVEQDNEMAQDIKDRMVKALKALIPSDNNRKVVGDLMNDPVYRDKMQLLELEEE